jgi:hypothetical protein
VTVLAPLDGPERIAHSEPCRAIAGGDAPDSHFGGLRARQRTLGEDAWLGFDLQAT